MCGGTGACADIATHASIVSSVSINSVDEHVTLKSPCDSDMQLNRPISGRI